MDRIKDSSFFFFGCERFLFLLAVSDDKKSLTPLPTHRFVKSSSDHLTLLP